MKNAELKVLLAVAGRLARTELKDHLQRVRNSLFAKLVSILLTQHSVLDTQHCKY